MDSKQWNKEAEKLVLIYQNSYNPEEKKEAIFKLFENSRSLIDYSFRLFTQTKGLNFFRWVNNTTGMGLDDIRQTSFLALELAARNYCMGNYQGAKCKFSTYLIECFLFSLKREIQANRVLKLNSVVKGNADVLLFLYNDEEELNRRMPDLPSRRGRALVRRTLSGRAIEKAESLETIGRKRLMAVEPSYVEDDPLYHEELREKVRTALERLKPIERRILELHFGLEGEEMNCTKISKQIGLFSKQHVHKTLQDGLERLYKQKLYNGLEAFVNYEATEPKPFTKEVFYNSGRYKRISRWFNFHGFKSEEIKAIFGLSQKEIDWFLKKSFNERKPKGKIKKA